MTIAEALEFLLEYKWLYQTPVTQILVENTLDKLYADWLEELKLLTTKELNELVSGGLLKDDWPSDLIEFVDVCREFEKDLSQEYYSTYLESRIFTSLPKDLMKGLSWKKQQEAMYLAKLTHEMCMKNKLDVVVDLGAGMGYICQILNSLYNYKVLGLESNPIITEQAIKRQKTLFPESESSVKYVCVRITEKSFKDIENNLKLFISSGEKDFCLIGLHSCGDLSVDAMKLFKNMTNARLMIIMSCCYHKMDIFDDGFMNFPVSDELKGYFKEGNIFYDTRKILQRPFLRLACQESSDRWKNMSYEEHQRHSLCILGRAVVELFCHQNEIKLKKTKRKSTRSSQCQNFDTYLESFVKRYKFNGQQLVDIEKIHDLWEEHEHKRHTAEIYTGLQLMLQATAEFLVLADRKQWLIEQGYSARILSVLDKKLSPRCHAIVSAKDNN